MDKRLSVRLSLWKTRKHNVVRIGRQYDMWGNQRANCLRGKMLLRCSFVPTWHKYPYCLNLPVKIFRILSFHKWTRTTREFYWIYDCIWSSLKCRGRTKNIHWWKRKSTHLHPRKKCSAMPLGHCTKLTFHFLQEIVIIIAITNILVFLSHLAQPLNSSCLSCVASSAVSSIHYICSPQSCHNSIYEPRFGIWYFPIHDLKHLSVIASPSQILQCWLCEIHRW